MNRLLALLPADDKAIALAATMPMALRGKVEVASYAPSALPDAPDDLLGRVSSMYQDDPQLHAAWEQAMATRMLTSDMAGQWPQRRRDRHAGRQAARRKGWRTDRDDRDRRLGYACPAARPAAGQLKGLDGWSARSRPGWGRSGRIRWWWSRPSSAGR
jgi:uncharacterized protein (DUF1501 family)